MVYEWEIASLSHINQPASISPVLPTYLVDISARLSVSFKSIWA